jgi:GNAT superfamily N-acetyltransferase
MPSIRTAHVSDAAAIVALGRAIDRDQLASEESLTELLALPPSETTERLVAEADGRVVAWAPSGLYASGDGWFWIGVDAAARGRGIGSRIYDRVEARLHGLGASTLATTPNDDDGRRFLLAREFERTNVVRYSELDPRVVEPAPVPRGTRVVPLGECVDRPQPLYELYAQGRADVPSETPRPPWTIDEWRRETIDSTLIDLDASVVVLEAGEPVALAWLLSDRAGARAEALMAATRRDRRGRGLATLAKVESSRRAAALGIERILTSNDVANAPMLAINRRLGFTETAIVESFAKRI